MGVQTQLDSFKMSVLKFSPLEVRSAMPAPGTQAAPGQQKLLILLVCANMGHGHWNITTVAPSLPSISQRSPCPALHSQSCVDVAFWAELGERKLDDFKLSEAVVPICGEHTLTLHQPVPAAPPHWPA